MEEGRLISHKKSLILCLMHHGRGVSNKGRKSCQWRKRFPWVVTKEKGPWTRVVYSHLRRRQNKPSLVNRKVNPSRQTLAHHKREVASERCPRGNVQLRNTSYPQTAKCGVPPCRLQNTVRYHGPQIDRYKTWQHITR